MTKDEFLLYLAWLFPMFQTRILKIPLKPNLKILPYTSKGEIQPYALECVEIRFEDFINYMKKRFLRLQREKI